MVSGCKRTRCVVWALKPAVRGVLRRDGYIGCWKFHAEIARFQGMGPSWHEPFEAVLTRSVN